MLKRHIDALSSLELAGECSDATAATAFLHTQKADVILLDIKMPGLSGLDFLATLA